jgi:1,3-alpha-isomaltosidase
MIRHNPPGRGHRYRDSLDQRTPVQPVADEPVTLRVLADPGIDRLLVDVAASGSVNTVAMTRDAARDGSGAATGGHLAAGC